MSFDPNLINTPSAQRVWYVGAYYSDPQWVIGAKGGLPHFDTHDVAIIVFGEPGCHTPTSVSTYLCGPIPAATTLNQYGTLPEANLVDELVNNTPVDSVGYGVQGFVNGSGVRRPQLQEIPGRIRDAVLRPDDPGGQQLTPSPMSSSSCTRTRAEPASATSWFSVASGAPTSFSP